jgi:hypothetical protein
VLCTLPALLAFFFASKAATNLSCAQNTKERLECLIFQSRMIFYWWNICTNFTTMLIFIGSDWVRNSTTHASG